jgi:hypothetical protein
LEALASERTEVLTYLEKERQAAFAEISDERNAIVKEVDALTLAAINHILAESRATLEFSISEFSTHLDRYYWRTIQLLALPFLLLALFIVLVMIWVRNKVNRILDLREKQIERQQ